MSWVVEYSAPVNLAKSINPAISGKPIAAVHDMIRKVVNDFFNKISNTIQKVEDKFLQHKTELMEMKSANLMNTISE